jgi:hypothetical protein
MWLALRYRGSNYFIQQRIAVRIRHIELRHRTLLNLPEESRTSTGRNHASKMYSDSTASFATRRRPRFQFCSLNKKLKHLLGTRNKLRAGVPLLCRRFRPDQVKPRDFRRCLGVTSVRARCRQIIEVYGDYSRELLKAG